jgi:hypothetical protein
MIESAEQFVFLRTSEDIKLYQRAASEPATDEIWLEVIEKFSEMRVWVVRNKTVMNLCDCVLPSILKLQRLFWSYCSKITGQE